MHFTQEDYKKIESWLLRNSVKDSEFQEALPLTGDESVVITQDNHNRNLKIKDFVDEIIKVGIADFLNITERYKSPNITLKEAIALVPDLLRKKGQVITFSNPDGNWEIYQFTGALNQWNNVTLWEDVFNIDKFIINSILPDEEDLTKSEPDENGNSYLSLKDREYNPTEFSGLGRVILRKNLAEFEDGNGGKVIKNYLSQKDFSKENTIYEIRYDFNLAGGEIEIPEGSVLDFQGGSLMNGKIIGNGTQLIRNCRMKDMSVNNILRKEFDLYTYKLDTEGYSEALQRIFNEAKSNEYIDIRLGVGTYNFESPIYVNPTSYDSFYYSIRGEGFSSRIQYNGTGALINVNAGGGVGIKIESVWCKGNNENQLIASLNSEDGDAPYFHYFELYNCFITSFAIAANLLRGYSVIVDRCQFRNNDIGLKLNCANHNSITNTNFPYGNRICIEYDNTNLPISSETTTISTLVQGCRFEGMNIGILFKSVWSTTVLGCYFEPLKDGRTVVINNDGEGVSSLTFISNYGFYDKYIELNGTLRNLSFIQNNMSILFAEGCSVSSIYIHNFDYNNFSIAGVTEEIGRNIYDDAITYNQYAPKNIIRPNLLSPLENFNGVATFDENNWEYVIAEGVKSSAYFNLYNIDLGRGNQWLRKFQVINAETNDVLYEHDMADPSFSLLHKPLFSIRGVYKIKLVIKCLSNEGLALKIPYSVTFSRRLHNTY